MIKYNHGAEQTFQLIPFLGVDSHAGMDKVRPGTEREGALVQREPGGLAGAPRRCDR